jgi:RNA-directed DNA polymerase
VANKDGRFAWRPYELMHPVIYVSLVNTICRPENWQFIVTRFSELSSGAVDCCSLPVLQVGKRTNQAAQIRSWWQKVEQQSIVNSLTHTHMLQTDVVDCYGSIYTHSISWALHGSKKAKGGKKDNNILGNQIDRHIQASRFGQTNGVCQGSILMDFIAEIVLGYVDELVSNEIDQHKDLKIVRYRDDYRIFANSDHDAEYALKLIADKLRTVGMKLGVSKTSMHNNVVEGSIKSDKLAGIELIALGNTNAATIQKQLLRLHGFGRRYPNSGALRRLLSELHRKIAKQKIQPDDLEVQVAIATDIAFVSPLAFPAVAGILSHLISLAGKDDKTKLWGKVRDKMRRVPHNGYLEIWLQRVTKPKTIDLDFASDEKICQIVDGGEGDLWESSWLSNKKLINILNTKNIIVDDASSVKEKVQPKELEIFENNALAY